MTRLTPVMLLSALFAAAPALASDMSGMKMNEHAMGMEATQLTHKATGTVNAIDAARGTITIAHGAVKSANWPAMKMAFKIAPDMASGVQAGQQVEFEFVTQGMNVTITKIATVK